MNKVSKVVPAILTDDPKTLESLVRQAESFTNYVQFDFMDGVFVPSRSVTCEHIGAVAPKLSWEAHLMVENPEQHLEGIRQAGAQKVIFHYEATSSPEKVIAHARRLGLAVGLAVNPETTVSSIMSLISELDSVLFLAVHPGFYGSQFIPEVLGKVPELRNTEAMVEIGVDGGIKEGNIAHVASIGVDVIYAGSAIFMQPKPDESYNHLQLLAEEGSRQRS